MDGIAAGLGDLLPAHIVAHRDTDIKKQFFFLPSLENTGCCQKTELKQ